MSDMSLVKRYSANTEGKDYVIGDIHGCFSKVKQKLEEIGFDETKDRLFSVGDLVDRGPECDQVLDWLNKSWFHPVRGNHDDYVCRYDTCDTGNWMFNGGAWFYGLMENQQKEFQIRFLELPIAIELETKKGKIGIVHADCVTGDWDYLLSLLENPSSSKNLKEAMNGCMWSRIRYENRMIAANDVDGVNSLVVGHTPVEKPTWVGNVIHIDTAGWHPNGYGFTVIDVEELESA